MNTLSRRQFVKYTGATALLPVLWPFREIPSMVLYNANIHTVDPTLPKANAIAIAGQRIIAVGSNADVRWLAGVGTKSIDLGGSTVVPGFNDAHSHPGYSGRAHLFNVDCDLRSIEAIKEAIKAEVDRKPPGTWIFGFKYDDTKTKEARFINRHDLDEVAPDHPVVITHRGGHTEYVNSMALKKAGVTNDTPDPEGGAFGRKGGELTGRILEKASEVFSSFYPETKPGDYVRGVNHISNMLAKAGITSVTDAGGSPEDLSAYHQAYQEGTLKTRIYCHIRHWALDDMIEAGVRTGLGDEWVRIGAMKTGCDGSISERTARLSEPYIGRPDDYGILTATREELYERCNKAHTNGWQIGVHANGDVAIDMTLGVYEQLQKERPRKDSRFRLEHCTVINEDLVRRIKAIGAIPNPFSTYVYFHGEKMKEYGAKRLNNMFALRSFLNAGIPVTQTSDYPPGPFEPMMAMQSSITRTDYKGQLWGPKQKVTAEEVLKIGTLNGAHASFEEHLKGTLEIGKLADLVVLSKDPLAIDPMSILETVKIERTMVDGKWVYEG